MIAKQKIHGFVAAFDYNNQKMELKNISDRAKLLDHNFFKYDRQNVLKEIGFLKQLRPNLTRDAYHVSLNFAPTDLLTPQQLVTIGREYLMGMGFEDNAYAIWQHYDADHLHIHLLACRIRFDGSVVADSNNYQRSEKLCRELEQKYMLVNVAPSKESLDRSPSKGELEMIQRTGNLSDRMLMQERVKLALSSSYNISDFIGQCRQNGIYLIFNQSESTGRVSGITYISSDGFIAKGQKLGNQYKWANLLNKLNYEQSRDHQTIGTTNGDTRKRFKGLLERGNREFKLWNVNSYRDSRKNFEESSHSKSKDLESFKYGSESRSFPDITGNELAKEREQESENNIHLLHSANIYVLADSFFNLFGQVGSDDNDEEQRRKRNKVKR